MKTPQWFLIALVTVSSVPIVVAQQAGVSAQESGSASANESATANGGRGSISMLPINGELVGKLDTKSAKVGDQVVVKTVESARTADGTEIPKGSRIVGHVTDVQAHSKTQADAHVAIQFDHAELKDGRSVPIRSVIASVSPSQAALAAMANGNTDEQMYGGSNAPMGRVGAGSPSAAGVGMPGAAGGAAGNAAGSTLGNAGSAAGNAGSLLGHTVGDAANNAGSTTGRVANTGSAGARSAVPGVMLAPDMGGATSGTFSASKQNVHLDGGTQIVLAIAGSVSQK